MSKLREQFDALPLPAEPLAAEPTGDARPFVVFTQLRAGGPYIYAGWLEAPDADMAMAFAKEHYGQDQECVNIQAIDRADITSSDGLYPPLPAGEGQGVRATATDSSSRDGSSHRSDTPSPQPSPSGRGSHTYAVFTQKRAGDLWISAGSVEAAKPQAAIDAARKSIKQAGGAHAIWVVAQDRINTTDGELIWRHTDQSYRLARGYGREVRAKWIAFRDEKQLAEYEKDDLQDAF